MMHEIAIRVRYHETDAMGYLHHAVYPVYFEMGRTELLRDAGGNYREMEERGIFLVVSKMEVNFLAPARYDDLLTLRTQLVRQTAVRLVHNYELLRDGKLLARATTTLACVDVEGKPQRVPAFPVT